MRYDPGAQERLDTVCIGGDEVELVWAVGTNFVTAQFTDSERSPRGIANVDRLNTADPVIVPLSHFDWLAVGNRAKELVELAWRCFLMADRRTEPVGGHGDRHTVSGCARAKDRNEEPLLEIVNEPRGAHVQASK